MTGETQKRTTDSYRAKVEVMGETGKAWFIVPGTE